MLKGRWVVCGKNDEEQEWKNGKIKNMVLYKLFMVIQRRKMIGHT